MDDGSGGCSSLYGLVSLSTSDTEPSVEGSRRFAMKRLGATDAIEIDRKASRLRRMKQGVLTAARLTNQQLHRGGFRYHAVMVTLTYRPGVTWQGRQVSAFLNCVRMWHSRIGKRMHCVWTAEMQKRGAVHYHLVFWLPSGYTLPKPDERGWWKHGDTNVLPAKCGVAYIAKYASKGDEAAEFPRGVRIHGKCGLDTESMREARWWRAPAEAREALGEAADIRVVKGGRVDKSTGIFWASPWRLILVWGRPHMFRIEKGVMA